MDPCQKQQIPINFCCLLKGVCFGYVTGGRYVEVFIPDDESCWIDMSKAFIVVLGVDAADGASVCLFNLPG